MTVAHYILPFVLVVSSLTAAAFDLKSRRIPNWLNFAILISGIIFNLSSSSGRGGLFALAGVATGAGLLLLPYWLGGMGAGDVKLMAALGALVGAKGILAIFVIASLFGGVLAVASFALKHRVAEASGGLLKTCLATHPSENRPKLSFSKRRLMIPYGVAIGCGGLTLAGLIL